MAHRFKQSICNEVFEGWSFADQCRAIRKAGYDGIEIAPFTLHEYPASITPAERRQYRAIMAGEGLEFAGLHWLMVSPKGLHVTTPDDELRSRSWKHIDDLIDLCADLGDGKIMVFGSPKQRNSTGGLAPAQALRNYIDGLKGVSRHAEQRGVTILVEALPKADSDIVNTLDDAAAIVREVGSPAIQTMFDTHNAADEREAHADVVDKHYELIRHVHINEMDGRHPGTGNYAFKLVFDILARRGYQRWVSLEVFDFTAGAETIANESLRYIESILEGVAS